MKQRLDSYLVRAGLAETRSQAANYIALGQVLVNDTKADKAGQMVHDKSQVKLRQTEKYVSRAGLKLASVASGFNLAFKDKVVLDVGSSTGGFTDYALQHGAKEVIAVDVGTNQLHPSLRHNPKIKLYEKTDIRNFSPQGTPNIVVMDVSFISLRQILPRIATISSPKTQIVAMVKPQFEAGKGQTNKGVVKNSKLRRQILQDFEIWSKQLFVTVDKADSKVSGATGNLERFYLLQKIVI